MSANVAACFGAITVAVVVCSMSLPPRAKMWWWLAGVIGLLVMSAAVIGYSPTSTILLDMAEVAGVVLVWIGGTPAARGAARRYFYALLPGIACTFVGLTVAGGPESNWPDLQKLAVDLLIVGLALKLALVPFCFWLPAVAADAPTMTAAVVIALVDSAAVMQLAGLREVAPWIFEHHASAWMAIALLSMLGGSLLALGQRELKRMLAFSSIADVGLLLVSVVAGGMGLSAVSIAALSHSLCKVLLFGAVGIAEQRTGRTVTLDTRGLGSVMPLAFAAFATGAVGLLGVSPLRGFAGYGRLYTAAERLGGPLLIGCLVAFAVLNLLCYARAIHRMWYGAARVATLMD